MTNILFYDIETTPLKAWIWALGDQVIRHGQLTKDRNAYDVICITYCWNDGKPAQAFDWGYTKQDSKPMMKAFDELIKQADVVIGKNNNRFDNQHLNLHRMMNRNEPLPDWTCRSDDLERQFRNQFGRALPSHALDYISEKLGLGGKIKMEMSDWIHILEKTPGLGKESFTKMLVYGKKDVEDTRAIWEFAEGYLKPKHLKPVTSNTMVCDRCGSNRVIKNGLKYQGTSIYQRWWCNNHHGHCGRTRIDKSTLELSKQKDIKGVPDETE